MDTVDLMSQGGGTAGAGPSRKSGISIRAKMQAKMLALCRGRGQTCHAATSLAKVCSVAALCSPPWAAP